MTSSHAVPVTHEMFMRHSKETRAYEWRLTDDSPIVTIPEDRVGELVESVKNGVPALLDTLLTLHLPKISEYVHNEFPSKKENLVPAIGELIGIVKSLKEKWSKKEGHGIIERARLISLDIEKFVSSGRSEKQNLPISSDIMALFSCPRTYIEGVKKQSEILIVILALIDAAKKDPKGQWVSASDSPMVPGQVKIPVGK
jgi:hypothetical protein